MIICYKGILCSTPHPPLLDGRNGVALSQVLQFFTGAVEIPVLGFGCTPILRFADDEIFPTSSTCAVELTLPMHTTQAIFEEKMVYGMMNHGGFGRC